MARMRASSERHATGAIALLVFALLIATVYDSLGQSQERPPVKEVQAQTSQNQSATEQRGTSESELVVATWVLAALALLQFGALCAQAFYLARTITHNRRVERAHISGGANHVTLTDGIEFLVVTINNYGKSHASIGTVAATICEEEQLDSFPGWGVKTWEGHPFIKKWTGYVFGQIAGQQIDVAFPFEAGKVIAGRIWYRDIFKKSYSIGFLLKTDDLTAISHKSFWVEREEKDPHE